MQEAVVIGIKQSACNPLHSSNILSNIQSVVKSKDVILGIFEPLNMLVQFVKLGAFKTRSTLSSTKFLFINNPVASVKLESLIFVNTSDQGVVSGKDSSSNLAKASKSNPSGNISV